MSYHYNALVQLGIVVSVNQFKAKLTIYTKMARATILKDYFLVEKQKFFDDLTS